MNGIQRLIGLGEYPILRYYGIKVFVNDRKSDIDKLNSNKSLGKLILFLGLSLLIISSIDVSKISSTLTRSEQSIWPSHGKGIWIGLFIMCIGIFTLISVREQTISSFNILLIYTIIGIIFCFFGLLTSISVLERYTKDPDLSKKENRNKEESIEFALSALLIGIFSLIFLFLSCLSCMICYTIPSFCQRGLTPDFNLRTPLNPNRPIHRRFIQNHYPTNRIYRSHL